MAVRSSRTYSFAATTPSSCRDARRRAVVAAGVLLALPVHAAHAAEWTLAPSMRWTADHASNRALAEVAEPGEGVVLDVAARLQRVTETTRLGLTSLVRAQRYSGASYADSDDYSLDLDFRQALERRELDLSAFDRAQNTLLSELESSGLIQADARRRDRGASAGITIDVSERLQGNVRASYSDVRYTGRNAALFPGYRYPALAGSLNYGWSARTTLFASASVGDLDVPGAPFGTRDTGVSLGMLREVGERFELELTGGHSRTETQGRSDSGWTGRAAIQSRSPRSSWELAYERTVQPSGLGTLVRRSVASAQYGLDLTSRLRVVANARSTRNASVLESNVGERRQVEDAEVRLDWRLSRNWSAGMKAGYARAGGRADALVTTDEVFEGWRAGLTMSWSPDPRPVGR